MRELALHFLDLARNSIEAGASLIELEISEQPAADRLTFQVTDNGHGMDEEVAEHAADAFFTTRTTRRFGLGLALLKGTCELCGGELEIRSKLGKGTTVRGHLQLGCVDRPPVGDMGAVVQCLALESDRVTLVYRHQVGERSFALDTRDVSCPLGIGRLTDPRVLCWLADYVNDQLRQLHQP